MMRACPRREGRIAGNMGRALMLGIASGIETFDQGVGRYTERDAGPVALRCLALRKCIMPLFPARTPCDMNVR